MSTAVEVLLAVAGVGAVSALCWWAAERLKPDVELTPEEVAKLAEAQAERARAQRERGRPGR